MVPVNPLESGRFSLQRERVILFILAAVQFTSIVDFMIVMPLGPQLMRSLSIGPAEFGLIVSSYTFAAGFSAVVAAALIDRFDRRTSFLVLFAGFLIGTFLCGIAPTYVTLVAARTLTGGFGGILGGMAMTIVGDVFPEQRRGRATGYLMLGFSVASVVGVPLGLYFGTNYGWHFPFLALALAGLPLLFLTPLALPSLKHHLHHTHVHPLRSLVENFFIPTHVKAFLLTTALMIGSFSVFPYVSAYFVSNVGLTERQLPIIYIVGGTLTLIVSPIVGRLTDEFGKLRIYRIIAPASALLFLTITNLPRVHVSVATAVFGLLMVSNIGRMIAAMAMITGSVEPKRRGGFLSANASVQHIACGIAAYLGGAIITESADGTIHNFGYVGLIAACSTGLTLWLAGRIIPNNTSSPSASAISLAAAAQASADDGEPMVVTAEQL
jgi:predicted MFS family arabinose efflux permease